MLRPNKTGFSLLELVAVVTLLGIVAAVVVYRLNSIDYGSPKSHVHQQHVTHIQTAVERYRSEKGTFPKSLAELVAAGYLPTTPTPPGGVGGYVVDGTTGSVRYEAGNDL